MHLGGRVIVNCVIYDILSVSEGIMNDTVKTIAAVVRGAEQLNSLLEDYKKNRK